MEEADDSLDKAAGMIPATVFTRSVFGIRGIRRIDWIRRLCRIGRKLFKRYVHTGQLLAANRAVYDRIITALCVNGCRCFVLSDSFARRVGDLFYGLRFAAELRPAYAAGNDLVAAARGAAACRDLILPDRFAGGMLRFFDNRPLAASPGV